MNTSDWIALSAALIALLALARGEARAWRARRTQEERVAVYWNVEWVSPGDVELRNDGLDEVRRVSVVVFDENSSTRFFARRLRPGQSIRVSADSWPGQWAIAERALRAGNPNYALGFRADAYWHTRAGSPHTTPFTLTLYRGRPQNGTN